MFATGNASKEKKPFGKHQHPNAEDQRQYDELKRKYALGIQYLLISNVQQSELRKFFDSTDDARKKYSLLKKFRQDIIDVRPKARLWIDKSFYYNMKITAENMSAADVAGINSFSVMIGAEATTQRTTVVSTPVQLDLYFETVAKIFESDKIWSDPNMLCFDIGERGDGSVTHFRAKEEQKQEEEA